MINKDLLPCPFCGGQALTKSKYNFIRCLSCDARAGKGAKDAWNKRSNLETNTDFTNGFNMAKSKLKDLINNLVYIERK